jgi:TRAP transporter 4TM/12TM fusion protein
MLTASLKPARLDDERGKTMTNNQESHPEVENGQSHNPTIEQLNEAEIHKFRQIKNPIACAILYVILGLMPLAGILYILRIHQHLGISLYGAQYIGLFLGLVLSAIFLGVPASQKAPRDSVPWYDWILAALGLYGGLYLLIFYPDLVMKLGIVTTGRFILSVIVVLLILEAIRRALGNLLVIVVLVFISYAFVAPYLPGVFQGSRTPVDQLFNYLYLDPNSMLDLLNIAASIALSFLLFGQVLLFFKGGDIMNDFALSLFGRFRGGPAKGAIVGSSLVGTITGGPVVNVMLTGSVTIPLMKRSGYTAAQAGAVESVASTGGQIMPPVMGIAAFIIAETLGIPYAEVALAALVPAILYYLCLFFQVDFAAGRMGLKPLSKEDIPSFRKVVKTGWVMVPILFSLIYFLFIKGYSPSTSGLYATVIAVIFLGFQKSVRQTMLRQFPKIFVETGKLLTDIGIVIAAAGLIVGITGITGLGFNMGFLLSSFAEYGLFFLLVMCAIVSVILGMGMPSVAAYSLVAVLVAPTLVELGVHPLAAHLFVFYFSIVSNFTPPVALACFAAGPIAKESPHKIGYQAMKYGIVAYIVPFLFVYAPALILKPEESVSGLEMVVIIATAIIGCMLLAMAVEGYSFRLMGGVKRIILGAIAICLLLPTTIWEIASLLNLIAFILAILFLINEWRLAQKDKQIKGQSVTQ